MADKSIEPQERIGLILVHGIGEQRRFEHLEGEARKFIDALRRRPNTTVTVDILAANVGTFLAEQNSWAAGPSLRIGVDDGAGYREFFLHEVWWADINESYSLAKQIRFWLWGLSMWSHPSMHKSESAGFQAMTIPDMPNYKSIPKAIFDWVPDFVVRLQLYAIGILFLMATLPFGIGFVLAKRLLNLSPPDFMQIVVNYVSGVKLYVQRRRYGSNLFSLDDYAFLDTIDEPPRVSVRRRMVEAMCDVALEPYDRWYVLAHSLGSVVAYNGLMEPAETLAHYLDKDRWDKLRGRGLAGSLATLANAPPYFNSPGNAPSMPARPVWLGPTDVVFRHAILANFGGLLTYGNPLEKFAAIWPARVAINKTEPHFPVKSEWINIYDPTDPVSGVIRSFTPPGLLPNCSPRLTNYGYKSHWTLLYSHLCYLDLSAPGPKNLADAIADWTLSGKEFNAPAPPHKRWFVPFGGAHQFRKLFASFEWAAVFGIIASLGILVGRWALNSVGKLAWLSGISDVVKTLWASLANALTADADMTLGLVVIGIVLLSYLGKLMTEPKRKHDALHIVAACGACGLAGYFWIDLFDPNAFWVSSVLEFVVACAIVTFIVGAFANVISNWIERADSGTGNRGPFRAANHKDKDDFRDAIEP